MSLNKFGSFDEYLRQTFEFTPDHKATAGTYVGIALSVLSLLLLAAAFFAWTDEARSGARFVGYFIWAGTLLYYLVPLFHSEYGAGKKQ